MPKRYAIGHAVYMNSHLVPVRDLDTLTAEQRRFLAGIVVRIPRLIEAIEGGTATASYMLGTKRLEDGRYLELELVARVPEDKWHGVLHSWGEMPSHSPGDEEA